MSMIDDIVKKAKSRQSGNDNEGKSRDDYKDEPKDDYSKSVKSSFDDLARILNVSDDDRDDFDSAMEDAIEAICERASNGD